MLRNRGKKQNKKDHRSFQNFSDTKETLHAKMGIIKDKNGMDLTEAEDSKKRVRMHRRIIQKRSSIPR